MSRAGRALAALRRRSAMSVLALSSRRMVPVSRRFGFDRGLPIDRYYIEDFLGRHSPVENYGAGDIRGVVLEVGESRYTPRFGGSPNDAGASASAGAIERLDVLHVDAVNAEATVIGDLTQPDTLPKDTYDCIVCTQTLHVIYDVAAAVRGLHQMLRPGGVVLATVAGISQTCRPDRDLWGDYWRLTSLSAQRLFEQDFPAAQVKVEAYGNVRAATAFLYGFAAQELTPEDLDVRDPDYEMLIAIRAQKQRASAPA